MTYLKVSEVWMYLVVMMDLYSWWIVGWHIDKHMIALLINKPFIKAYNLPQPKHSLIFAAISAHNILARNFVICSLAMT